MSILIIKRHGKPAAPCLAFIIHKYQADYYVIHRSSHIFNCRNTGFAVWRKQSKSYLPDQFVPSFHLQTHADHTAVTANSNAVLSCSARANPSSVDSCCAETFGGLLLSTQYWDTYTGLESQGQLLPQDTWTLHGLWPDYCNGSYTQYCDVNRQFDPSPSPNVTDYPRNGTVVPKYTGPGVGTFIQAFGRYDLLAYMNT